MKTKDRRARRPRVVALCTAFAALAFIHFTRTEAAPQIPQQMTAEQAQAAQRLPDLKTLLADARGVPTLIEADLGPFRAEATSQALDADALLRNLRGMLRANGSEQIRVRKDNRDVARGVRHYRMRQLINGREVIGGEMIVHVDERTSRVTSIDAQFLPGTGLPTTESFSAADALRNGLAEIGATNAATLTTPRLAYARTPDGSGYLVWAAQVRYTDAKGASQTDEILVDATTARFVQRLPQVHDSLSRQIYYYPSTPLLISEGGSTGDSAAANVYAYAGDTYNYYWNTFSRDSWNAAGAAMLAYVHGTDVGQNNAVFSCGTGAAQFGDGDGVTFGPFSSARDIVAHEWTHGVTCSEANLTYSGESGALNESMSDIFGASVEAYATGVTSNTWLVGEGAYTPGVGGDALRYMANPTADGNSRDYYPQLLVSDDVHYGSGIANLAFYLLANGGTHPRGMTSTVVTGIGITKSSRIFYLALRDYLMSSSDYSAAREQTARVAAEQYGTGSTEHRATCAAWDAVGAPNTGSYCTYTDNTTMTMASQTVNVGYLGPGYGSMSPATTSTGKTYTNFYDSYPCVFGGCSYVTGTLTISGFGSNPGAAWLISATAGSTTMTGASATYSYNSSTGIASWLWYANFGFLPSGTKACTIVHR